MLELEKAIAQILAAVPPPIAEAVMLSEAPGRFLAERVYAAIDLPVFDNSAMDGFAVHATDVALASHQNPARLEVVGRVPAGEKFQRELARGSCVRLFTGSPLPRGADAVVMQEDTHLDSASPAAILVLESAKPGENLRRQGEDVQKGAVLGEPGDYLTSCRMALLAAAGAARLEVARQPRIGVLATGSELAEPGKPLGPGQIYESNRLMLAQLVKNTGAMTRVFPLVPDTLPATRHALEQAFTECDAVITSGGASVGEMDFIKHAFADVGGDLQFWKVAIRPGRPFVFGRKQQKLLFGLPGNPVSALITFLLLVRPALLRWQGARELSLPSHPGVLAESLANPGARRHFMRVTMDANGTVRSAGAQASHVLSSLARANGLVDMPAEANFPAGRTVSVLRWDM